MEHGKPIRTTPMHTALGTIVAGLALSLPMLSFTADPPSARSSQPEAAAPAQAENSGLSEADRKFMQEAALGGVMEVELGRVAMLKSSNDRVREMAQHIVDDHTQANERLQALARAKGVDIPAQLDTKHQKQVDKMQKLSADRFDREYTALMVSDHKEDIKEFRRAAAHAGDADLKQFAAGTLPSLEQHLRMAENAKQAGAGNSVSPRHVAAPDNMSQ